MLRWKNGPFAIEILIGAIIGASLAHASWAADSLTS
jgi:type III secretory pathway component EscT